MLKQIFKKTLLALLISLGLCLPLAPATVYAQSPAAKKAACEGVGLAGGTANCDDPAVEKGIGDIIKTVLELLSLVVGVVAVIMIVISGLKYITSAGDSNKISSAKDSLVYALVGLAVVAVAQALVRFVVHRVPG